MIEQLIRQIVREEIQAVLAETGDRIITTDEVMARYSIRSRSTLNSYHRMGLPYIKGNPNRYRERDLIQFFTTNRIIR